MSKRVGTSMNHERTVFSLMCDLDRKLQLKSARSGQALAVLQVGLDICCRVPVMNMHR